MYIYICILMMIDGFKSQMLGSKIRSGQKLPGNLRPRFIWAWKHDWILIMLNTDCPEQLCPDNGGIMEITVVLESRHALPGFEPMTICFHHRFKMPRELWGVGGGLKCKITVSDSPHPLLKQNSCYARVRDDYYQQKQFCMLYFNVLSSKKMSHWPWTILTNDNTVVKCSKYM